MTTLPLIGYDECSLQKFGDMSRRYEVPVEDILLIAINMHGISSDQPRHRARIAVRLATAPSVPWNVIVPLNANRSPFTLDGDQLSLGRRPIGNVQRIDADEAVGGYFRDNGHAATLNPNARSRCTGCAFCPNTLEAAADPRLREDARISELLEAMQEQHPERDLTKLREVTVSTGCFEREPEALRHLRQLRKILTAHGITARIGFLTSVLRSDDAFRELAASVSPFVLRLTIECLTRRDLLLKASKASLARAEMADLLTRARNAGLETSFTYIVGLDPISDLRTGLRRLAPGVSAFPNFQVYQAHNSIMAGMRAPGADSVEFFLRARREIEQVFEPTELRPQAWEGYRSLWYFAFADENLVPR
jgi:hypothetical protein